MAALMPPQKHLLHAAALTNLANAVAVDAMVVVQRDEAMAVEAVVEASAAANAPNAVKAATLRPAQNVALKAVVKAVARVAANAVVAKHAAKVVVKVVVKAATAPRLVTTKPVATMAAQMKHAKPMPI